VTAAANSDWFVGGETYRRTITHPITGENGWVDLRPLNAGDRAELQDLVRMQFSSQDDDTADETSAALRVGAMQLLTLERAIVEWSLPSPPSPVTIRQLHPEVFSQIYAEVSWGRVPPPETEEEKGHPLPAPPDASASPSEPGDDKTSS
jgi:hypothetical protein